jgi:hypothetical protein
VAPIRTAARHGSSLPSKIRYLACFHFPHFGQENTKNYLYLLRSGGAAMEEPYAIRQHDDHWVVSAREQEILTCAQLTDALRAVKEATDILNYMSLLKRDDSTNVVSYSHSNLNALQLVAHKQGFRIELHDDRFYLRSIEPLTIHSASQSVTATPTNHLPYFRTLGEIRRFLIGE